MATANRTVVGSRRDKERHLGTVIATIKPKASFAVIYFGLRFCLECEKKGGERKEDGPKKNRTDGARGPSSMTTSTKGDVVIWSHCQSEANGIPSVTTQIAAHLEDVQVLALK